MKFINKKFLIIFALLFLPSLILLFKSIEVKPQLEIDGQIINFPNTDDLQGESLIIRSDQSHYEGDTGSDAYFSITNTSQVDESAILLFYFPGQFIPNRDDPPEIQPATIASLEQREGDSWRRMEFFSKNIKINDDLLGQAVKKRKPIPEDFVIKAGTQVEIKAGQTVYFKSHISFRPTDSGEFWIEALGRNGGYGLLDPTYSGTRFGSKTSTDTAPAWFASGSLDWTHRKKITIDYKKVSGGANLSNFPVLFSVIDSTLATTANGGKAASGSGEFVFTSSNGTTVLPHEIERYTATTGELISWVNVSTLSATQDTTLYIYYGGPAAGTKTNQRKSATWDSNYKIVWHLPDGTTLTSLDSTSNANNGTQTNTPSAVAGQIDGAAGLTSASTEYISSGANVLNPSSTDFTASFWVFSTSNGTDQQPISQLDGTGTGRTWMILTSGGIFRSFLGGSNGDFTTTVLRDIWEHVVLTKTGTTIRLYVNGVLDPTTVTKTVESATGVSRMGASKTAGAPLNGRMDEFRISDTLRSAGWIATEYNNQFRPSTFYTLGGLEAKTPNGPGLKIKGGVKFR